MCQFRQRPSLRKRAFCRFSALDDVLLAQILRFSSARDVEALAVASSVVARVLPQYPQLWRSLFMQRWATLNFPLPADATVEIEPKLKTLFQDCNESRMFQLLTHAVVPVPSYADLDQTKRYQGYDDAKHEIQTMHDADTRPSHVVRFAFNGADLGDDRSVRANVPFPSTHHVAVFKRSEGLYQVGIVASGYFEIQIVKRNRETQGQGEETAQTEEEELTSLGLVPASFPLVGRQPGWNQRSYGYHGDDGRLYKQTTRGRHFGPRFGVGDIVGCGVRRDMHEAQSHVFFTSNGQEISRLDEGEIQCPHSSLYPAVGVDSYNEVRVNFGQEPFAHDKIADKLFAECGAAFNVSKLPWHYIHEYSIESLVWRNQQSCEARAEENPEAVAQEASAAKEEDAETGGMDLKKWVGMLTRRQQNRLASNEENASEERAAAAQQ